MSPGSPGPVVQSAVPAPAGATSAVAAARGYVRTVWTYTPATYAQAAGGAGWTTPALASRTRPSRAEAGQVLTADQHSAVVVTAAGLDAEAPNGPTTASVSVAFTATVTYRGAGSGQPVAHVWEVRVVRTGGRWLADAVLAAD